MKIYLWSIILLLFIGCSIEEISETIIQYDTIYPKPFFPVYPGSWWKYIENDSLIRKDSTSPIYILNTYRDKPIDYLHLEDTSYSDPVYVPFFNNRPIYAYSWLEYNYPPFGDYYEKWSFLSEKSGEVIRRYWRDSRFPSIDLIYTVIGKTLRNNDSILILKGNYYYIDMSSGFQVPCDSIVEWEYYKKYVGLIEEYSIDTVNNDTLNKKILVDYFINY